MQDRLVMVKHKESLDHKVVSELDDTLFNQGYRFVRYVKFSEIDYPEWLAQQQDELDKLNNEPPWRMPCKA